MKKLFLAVVLCLFSVQASANTYFTSAEVTSIQGIYTAMIQIEGAWSFMATTILTTDVDDAANINGAWTNMNLAEYHMSRGLSCLYNVDPDTGADGCGVSRAATVTAAKAHIVLAAADFTTAKPFFTDCKTTGSTSGIRSACASAESAMTAANTALTVTFDTGLSYTNFQTAWYPFMLGPHGSFDEAVFQMVQAIDQMRQGMDLMRRAWYWPGNSESVWGSSGSTSNTCTPTAANHVCAWARVLVRMGLILNKFHISMMSYNVIPYPNASQVEGNSSYHVRAELPALQILGNTYEFMLSNHSESQSRTHAISGLPYHYDNFGLDSYITLTEAETTRTTSRALFTPGWRQITIDSWFHSDGSVWLSFEFPNEATLQALRAAKEPLNDPNGPPVTVAH